MAVTEISPVDFFERVYRHWWLLAIPVLLGGLLGWGYHRLHAPLYEATATLVITINYQQEPALIPPNDVHYEEDHIINTAKALASSTYVLDQVIAALQARGISKEAVAYGRNITTERKQSLLELHARNTDPQIAADVVNLWADRAYTALVEAHGHATKAKILNDYLAAMGNCPLPPENDPPLPSVCGTASPEEIKQAIQIAEAELQAETLASKGIIPALVFDLSQKASVPDTPIAYRVNLLILAGALIGFVVGTVITSSVH